MNVLVRGSFANNLGDDLFINVLLERYPNHTFFLIAEKKYKSFATFSNCVLLGYPWNVFFRMVVRSVKFLSGNLYRFLYTKRTGSFYKKHLKYCDVYLVIGGSMFKENVNSSTELAIEQEILPYLKYKKSFIVGANFGAFKTQSFLNAYADIFSKYTDVCFRDNYSYNLFCNLKNIRKATDVVFSLDSAGICKKNKTIGIVVVDLTKHSTIKGYTEQYEHLIKKIIYEYSLLGYKTTLFAFQKGEYKYIKSLSKKIEEMVKTKVSTLVYSNDLKKFLKEYLSQEVIFATRFHSLVLSLINKQKICPILYDEKMEHLLEDLGYKGEVLHLDSLNINAIQIRNINKSETCECFLKKQALKQFEQLDLVLKSHD